jgi:hypothetical protein
MSSEEYQIEIENIIPLINDLEIQNVFKNENGEKGSSVTNLMEKVLRLLRLVEIISQWIKDL